MNTKTAKQIILAETPSIKNHDAWLSHMDKLDKAKEFLVNEKYDSSYQKRVLEISDKLSEHDQEEGYEVDYKESYKKAVNILSAKKLSMELKIKSLQKDIKELEGFGYEVKRGDFSCLRIGLNMKIEEELEKEVNA